MTPGDPSPTPPPGGEGLSCLLPLACREGGWELLSLVYLPPLPEPLDLETSGAAARSRNGLAEGIPTDWKFWLAKMLHTGAYTFLTLLARWLPVRRTVFWCVVCSWPCTEWEREIGQTYVPNRHGCVRDVMIDWVGIGMGLVVVRWWERRAV